MAAEQAGIRTMKSMTWSRFRDCAKTTSSSDLFSPDGNIYLWWESQRLQRKRLRRDVQDSAVTDCGAYGQFRYVSQARPITSTSKGVETLTSRLFWNQPSTRDRTRLFDPLRFDALRESMADKLMPVDGRNPRRRRMPMDFGRPSSGLRSHWLIGRCDDL
jgi:hypothetical protein